MVVTPENQSSDQDRVLIVDKAFLKPTSDKLRGVELFNLHLVRELMTLGYKVTFVSLRSWQSRIFSVIESNKPDFLWVPNLGNAAISALLVPWLLRDQQHDTLLIGNVGKGLIPLIRKLTKPGRFKKTVCIAHRESCDRFAQLCADIDCTVVAVSGGIARSFDGANCSRVAVDYGIMNADQFHPPAQKATAPDEKINFCVLGMLDMHGRDQTPQWPHTGLFLLQSGTAVNYIWHPSHRHRIIPRTASPSTPGCRTRKSQNFCKAWMS